MIQKSLKFTRLKNVKSALKSHVNVVLQIMKNIKDEHLEFSEHTIFREEDNFKKLIPNLDQLQEIASQYRGELPRDKPLSGIRDYFMRIQKHMDAENSFEYLKDLENFQSNVLRNSELHNPMLGLDLKFFEHNGSQSPERRQYDEENKKAYESIKSLEELTKERDFHISTIPSQIKAIQELKHRKIFRTILSRDGSLPKIASGISTNSESYGYHKIQEGIYGTLFSIDVCAICYSLVWHVSEEY